SVSATIRPPQLRVNRGQSHSIRARRALVRALLEDLHAVPHLQIQLGAEPLHVVLPDAVLGAQLHDLLQARGFGLKVAVDTDVAAIDPIHLPHGPSSDGNSHDRAVPAAQTRKPVPTWCEL